MNKVAVTALASLTAAVCVSATDATYRDNYSDTWVATDALGRSLPINEQVGDPKQDRTIGMFYFLWLGRHAQGGPFDITKITAQYPDAMQQPDNPAWGGKYAPHHWGESWFGYYLSTDPAIYEKHARMLSDMGVDVIIFDTSNNVTYTEEYLTLCESFMNVRKHGGKTPQIAFLCPFGNPTPSLNQVWRDLYSKNLYPELWYKWKGKPLVMADPSFVGGGVVYGKNEGAFALSEKDIFKQQFKSDKELLEVAASVPTWNTKGSAVTFTLKNKEDGKIVAQKRFDKFLDNEWLELRFKKPISAGEYVLELSEPIGKVGWWYQTANEVPGGHAFKNDEAMDGGFAIRLTYEDDPLAPMKDFFTFRKPQPEYFPGPTGPNQWSWLEVYPQHVFYTSDGQPEQMSVGVAQNATDGKLSVLSNPRSCGRSYHNGAEPDVAHQDTTGRNFQEQWNRAHQVNPPFIFITGWNEWIAGRFGSDAPFYGAGPVSFVDQYNAEYSRDIEPGNCPHSDNYYYQAIANIRKYKGVRKIDPVASAKIKLDCKFDDWIEVAPEFRDDIGDPVHRDFPGWGDAGTYVNQTGRNDISTAKISLWENNLYVYVQTSERLTDPSDDHWMILYLNTDGNPANGWFGYDYRLAGGNSRMSYLQKQIGNPGEYTWTTVARVSRAISENQMEARIPLAKLRLSADTINQIDFKWADNIQETGEAKDLTINGDVAPNDRYNYRAIFK